MRGTPTKGKVLNGEKSWGGRGNGNLKRKKGLVSFIDHTRVPPNTGKFWK